MSFSIPKIKRILLAFAIALVLWLPLRNLTGAPLYRDNMPYRQALSREVAFWKMVFTRYSQDDYILHDSENLNVIYKVVTFDSSLTRRQRERKLNAIKKDIKKLLLRFHSGKVDTTRLDSWERYVYEQFRNIPGKNKFRRASRRIRTQQGIRGNFVAGVTRSYAYLPYLKKIFREEGLPEELIYLPHVESSFNPHAVSHVGAVGMWQFMRRTARQFMKINRVKDERFDPLISTRAAARLLKRNYSKLHDWALAITAYNHGLAGMKRARRRYGNYLKIRDSYLRRSFGFASKNFYPEFLAVVEIMDSLDFYFPDIARDSLMQFQEIKLPLAVKINRLAERFRLDIHELKRLNPGFRIRVWRGSRKIPAGYKIRLPLHADANRILAALETQRELVQQTVLAGKQPPQGKKREANSREVLAAAVPAAPLMNRVRHRPAIDPDLPGDPLLFRSDWLRSETGFPVIAHLAVDIREEELLPVPTASFPSPAARSLKQTLPGQAGNEFIPVTLDVADLYPLREVEREICAAELQFPLPFASILRHPPEEDVVPVPLGDDLFARVSFPESPVPVTAPGSLPEAVLLAMNTPNGNQLSVEIFDFPPAPAPEPRTGSPLQPRPISPKVYLPQPLLAGQTDSKPTGKEALLMVEDVPKRPGKPSFIRFSGTEAIPTVRAGVEPDDPLASETLSADLTENFPPFAHPRGDFYDPLPRIIASAQEQTGFVPDTRVTFSSPESEKEYPLQENPVARAGGHSGQLAHLKLRVPEAPAEGQLPVAFEAILVTVRTSTLPDVFPRVLPLMLTDARVSPKPGVEDVDDRAVLFASSQPPRSGEELPLTEAEHAGSDFSRVERSFADPVVDPQWFAPEAAAVHDVLSRSEIVFLLKQRLKIKGDRIKVFPQETIGHFSEWLGISTYRLRRLNHLSRNNKIYTGQELVLDFSHVTPSRFFERRLRYHLSLLEKYMQGSSGVRLITHRIERGENLWNLAHQKYKFPVNLLLYFNDFDKLERLFPGDVINLPVKYN